MVINLKYANFSERYINYRFKIILIINFKTRYVFNKNFVN